MLAAQEGVGAQQHLALGGQDHRVRIGDPGRHIQIQHKIPAAQVTLNGIGRRQIRDEGRVLLQIRQGLLGQKILDQILEGGAQQQQRQQKDGGRSGKSAAKGCFHAYSTSNL